MKKELIPTDMTVITGNLLEQFTQFQETGVAIPQDVKDLSISNYTRLKEGDNKFRLIAPPVYGSELWFRKDRINEETGEVEVNQETQEPYQDRKVLRFMPGAPIITPSELKEWKRDRPRRFISLLVYNYATGGIEILSVTQNKLFEDLFNMLKFDIEANNPYKSDFIIKKTFEANKPIRGKITPIHNYSIKQLGAKEETPKEIIDALQLLPFVPDLTALFRGDDPFEFEQAEDAEFEPMDENKAKAEAATQKTKEALNKQEDASNTKTKNATA